MMNLDHKCSEWEQNECVICFWKLYHEPAEALNTYLVGCRCQTQGKGRCFRNGFGGKFRAVMERTKGPEQPRSWQGETPWGQGTWQGSDTSCEVNRPWPVVKLGTESW